LKKALVESGADIIVTTEKDLVRLDTLDLKDIKLFTLNIEFELDDNGKKHISSFLN